MKRSKHSLSHYKLATFDMGELVPVGCYEVLPGDTVQQATSALLRVSPLLAPVMHPVSVRIHHWYVPNRLLWDGWEAFITGGSDGQGDGAVWPYMGIPPGPLPIGGLADYLGIPVGGTTVAPINVSALPFRAYALVFNENYRDQDLVPPVAMSKAGGADTTTNVDLQLISWEKEYFSLARPWPQKGPDVTLPLGTSAPVKTAGSPLVSGVANPLQWKQAANGSLPSGNLELAALADGTTQGGPDTQPGGGTLMYPSNLFADLAAASAVNVNDVRRAFALQRYQEARAQYGSRYTEYLRYIGVRSSDARLQRPEYLGGGKQTISFSEVLKTGAGEDPAEPIGTLKGHGITAMRSRRYRRFFEEHGLVVSLMSVRPRTMYQDGLHRMWSRSSREAYWQRELELIGQQEILNKEVYAFGTTPDGVFGYGDRYSEYRHLPSQVCGEFRSSLLNFWHLARQFGAAPVLNQAFIECVPSKRINAVQTNDVLWTMINHSIQARRMVTKRTIGRIV